MDSQKDLTILTWNSKTPESISKKFRKNEVMYHLFGEIESKKCKDCPHLFSKQYDKRYYKCKMYGDSNSEATDWAKSWTACGLIDKEINDFLAEWGTVMNYIRHKRPRHPREEIDGQISIEDLL